MGLGVSTAGSQQLSSFCPIVRGYFVNVKQNYFFLGWWNNILFSNLEIQVFHQPKTFCHNLLRRLPIEFSGNIYGRVSSVGYLCIVSPEICSKIITMWSGFLRNVFLTKTTENWIWVKTLRGLGVLRKADLVDIDPFLNKLWWNGQKVGHKR